MTVESNALIIGWNRAVVNRESAAAECFASTVAYFEKLERNGKITGFDTVLLSQHGGDFNGFFVLKGTNADLDWVRSDEEFVDNIVRATHCLTNVGVIPGYTGVSVGDMMTRWTKSIPR